MLNEATRDHFKSMAETERQRAARIRESRDYLLFRAARIQEEIDKLDANH